MPKPQSITTGLNPKPQNFGAAGDAARAELAAGLRHNPARISPKYFYDELGSKLFESICLLDEYYLTRVEAAIFTANAQSIAQAAGQGVTLIDLGAGNCAKAARLFPLLLPAQYVAVDISFDFLREALASVQQRFPQIAMTALGMDFSSRFELPATVRAARRLFFYPGSSVGNFSPDEAIAFLRRLRANAGPGDGLLIGVDLIKDAALLDAAYDDALGLTAAFNLNALRHLNQLLGADFDVSQWRHHAFFNPAQGRVEMHLEARRDLAVAWQGQRRAFMQGERIHTENSYKYTQSDFAALLGRAGFATTQVWTDPADWFAVFHARVQHD